MRRYLFAFLAYMMAIPAMADNLIKFESAAVEDAINTLVAQENRQAAADEFQKQMDQTTGKISVMGIYKVCAAAGKDINTNKGYSDCRYFINQIADKSGFGTKSATQANCANSFNGIWSLSPDGTQYQCVGKDGFKLVYKKSCDGAGGDCIKDFAGLKTQGPVGREFIAEYAKKKNLQLTCYIGFETRRGLTSPLGQDYIRCSAGGKAYEFEFDSLNETPGKTSIESENKTMCEFFGGKIVKYPDSSIEKIWQSCDISSELCSGKIHSLALRIGHTNQYQGYCRLSRAVQTNSTVFLNQITGVDSYVFYKSGAQMRADMAKVQLEEYLRNTFPKESYINCGPTIKKLEGNGLGVDIDYLLTCTVGSKQVDFVFDDLTESSKKRADTGMDAMQCITNGGTFKGESCRGPTKDECTKLDAALRAKGSTEGAKWDDKVRACILGNALKTYKQDVAANYIVGTVVIVGGSVMVIVSGGAATPVLVAGGEMLLTDAAFNVAIDLNHRRLSKQAANRFGSFMSDAEKCNDEPCALNVLKKHYATLSGVMSDLNKDDQAVVDETMDRLIGLIKTEYVACGKNNQNQIVYAKPAECAIQGSKLRLIDYIDTLSEPVLIIGSIIYNPGYVTKRFLDIRKVSRIEKAEDLYRASIKTADDKKLFALYMKKGNRDIPFEEFKQLYGGSASAAEEALKSKKTWAEISEARKQATALEKELDAELKAAGWRYGLETKDLDKVLEMESRYNPKVKELAARVEEYKKLATNDVPSALGKDGERLQKQVNKLDDETKYWATSWTIQDDIDTRLKQGSINEEQAQKLKELLKSNTDMDGLVEFEDAYMQVFVDDRKMYGDRFAQNYSANKAFAEKGLYKQINNDIVKTVPITNKDFVVAERKELYARIIDSDPNLRRQAVYFDKLSDSEKMDFANALVTKADEYLGSGRGTIMSADEYVKTTGREKWTAGHRGSQSSRTNNIIINLDPDEAGRADVGSFTGTVAHENAHRVDDVNPGMGMLGEDRVFLSDRVYRNDVADIYNTTLLEESAYAVGDAVDADITRLTQNRWQQMVALDEVTPAYKTARVGEGAEETANGESLDLIMKYIDLATH